MNEHGRKYDVIVENQYRYNQSTGIREIVDDEITVFADAGMTKLIEKVEGVLNVFTTFAPYRYSIYLDPRYDKEFVKKEIEAAILCAK